jgi:hypothetical protein
MNERMTGRIHQTDAFRRSRQLAPGDVYESVVFTALLHMQVGQIAQRNREVSCFMPRRILENRRFLMDLKNVDRKMNIYW